MNYPVKIKKLNSVISILFSGFNNYFSLVNILYKFLNSFST